MLIAIRHAREKKVPYFGICLGMQTACIEFARNVVGLAEANSSGIRSGHAHRVIYKLRELRGVEELGGTMRLGAWTCKIEPVPLAYRIYGKVEISERHRHRYEFNREVRRADGGRGVAHLGLNSGRHLCRDGGTARTIRISLAASFNPEFKSKPLEPHPLFRHVCGRAYEHGKKRGLKKESAAVEMFHRPERVARR